jgi:hypothetical protein
VRLDTISSTIPTTSSRRDLGLARFILCAAGAVTFFLAVVASGGCSDDNANPPGGSTDSLPPATTSVDPTTSSTGDTSEPTSEPTSTSDDTTTTSTSGTVLTGTGSEGSTDDTTSEPPPVGCLDGGYDCAEAPMAEDFCSYLADACGSHDIPQHYCDIVAVKCRVGEDACSTCFYLANTCSQVGLGCDELYAECACVAEGLGQQEQGDPGQGGTPGEEPQR